MKNIITKPLTLVLSFLLVFSAFTTVFASAQFSDYESHWAKETIQSAISSGNVKGYFDGSFKPDNAITRAEFFEMVNNVFTFTNEAEITYSDVSGDAWYASAVAKAKAAGYIGGYPDGAIKPDYHITRQEVAVIISRLKSLTMESNNLSFTDAASIASWSRQDVIAVADAKLMIGYSNGSFQPEAPITRAEALVTITRAFDYATVKIAVDDIDVSKETMTLIEGGATGTITAVIEPSNATNQNVIWTSSDKNVATVKDGVVNPKAAGTAIITAASSENGTITATTTVTVISENESQIDTVNLGTAGKYAILAKTGISTLPNSIITGNIGVRYNTSWGFK